MTQRHHRYRDRTEAGRELAALLVGVTEVGQERGALGSELRGAEQMRHRLVGPTVGQQRRAEITVRAAPADAVILPRSVVTLSANGDLGIRVADKDNKIVFYPIDLMDDLTNGLVLGGVPKDARVVVAGQDLVTEGDLVNPVAADEQLIKKLVGEVAGTN